jgi:hypothetical protein
MSGKPNECHMSGKPYACQESNIHARKTMWISGKPYACQENHMNARVTICISGKQTYGCNRKGECRHPPPMLRLHKQKVKIKEKSKLLI